MQDPKQQWLFNYMEYDNQPEDEIDASMALSWELSQQAPLGCKSISQLRKESEFNHDQ